MEFGGQKIINGIITWRESWLRAMEMKTQQNGPHNLQKKRCDEWTFIFLFMLLFVCIVHPFLKSNFRETGNSCNDTVFCFLLLSKHKTSVFDLCLFTSPFISQTKEESMIKGHWNMWALGALGGISLYDRELTVSAALLSSRCSPPCSAAQTHLRRLFGMSHSRQASLAPGKSPLQPEDCPGAPASSAVAPPLQERRASWCPGFLIRNN